MEHTEAVRDKNLEHLHVCQPRIHVAAFVIMAFSFANRDYLEHRSKQCLINIEVCLFSLIQIK